MEKKYIEKEALGRVKIIGDDHVYFLISPNARMRIGNDIWKLHVGISGGREGYITTNAPWVIDSSFKGKIIKVLDTSKKMIEDN